MTLVWPNGSTSRPRRTSPFGPRRHPVTGKFQSLHKGVDLAGWPDLVAPVTGRVTRHENQPSGAGHWIEITEDGTGHRFRMFHMAAASPIPLGGRVAAGAYVGRMGKTGTATAVHVHLETWAGSTVQDPEIYYARRLGSLTAPAVQPGKATTHRGDDDMLTVQWKKNGAILTFGPQQLAYEPDEYKAEVLRNVTGSADPATGKWRVAADRELSALMEHYGVPQFALNAVLAGNAFAIDGTRVATGGHFWSWQLESFERIAKGLELSEQQANEALSS